MLFLQFYPNFSNNNEKRCCYCQLHFCLSQMFASFRNKTSHSSDKQPKHQEREWITVGFKPENLIPGLVIGFLLGFILDLSKPKKKTAQASSTNMITKESISGTSVSNGNLKMVLVVRGDLKMGAGKVASQCAHAATGIYAELMHSSRSLLRQWELSGQAKIVVTCKNLQEMTKLKELADIVGLPTFVVADAGRTQVSAGCKTVLAIGPGDKSSIDSVTGHLRLL